MSGIELSGGELLTAFGALVTGFGGFITWLVKTMNADSARRETDLKEALKQAQENNTLLLTNNASIITTLTSLISKVDGIGKEVEGLSILIKRGA